MKIRIERCVCTGRSFASLLSLARRRSWGLQELQAGTGAGSACGLCLPYLRVCLRDGVTVFRALLPVRAVDAAKRGGQDAFP